MSSSRPLTELVRDFRAAGGTADERVDTLVLRGRFANAGAQSAWMALSQAAPAPMPAVQVYDPEIGGDVGAADAFDPTRAVNITIVKPAPEGVAYFFFQDTLAEVFAAPLDPIVVRIADLPPTGAFRARGLDVGPWVLDAPPPPRLAPIPIDPSKLVADHVPAREVPRDLSPWVLQTPPAETSTAYAAWGAVAPRRLLSGLASNASLEGGVVWLQASGPPIFRIRADDPGVATARERLDEAVTWVFLSGSDIEARHRLFGGELARAERPGQDFGATLSRALAAAKVAYDAHVQSASRETLKALADLRKTVIEETQKVTQRAQDMTTGLARDLAVSAAPFVLKILADAGKVAAPTIAAAFYFAAAAFVGLSFALQWRINKAFLRSQKVSRRRWMRTLYTYISDKEREEIADQPIEQAVENYRETRAVLLGVYLALVGVLIVAGVRTLTAPPPAAPAAAQTSVKAAPPPPDPKAAGAKVAPETPVPKEKLSRSP